MQLGTGNRDLMQLVPSRPEPMFTFKQLESATDAALAQQSAEAEAAMQKAINQCKQLSAELGTCLSSASKQLE